MTQKQRDAVTAAQNRFFDAEDAATRAQAASVQAEAAVESAKTNATVTAPAAAQALVKGANDAFFQAEADQKKIIAVAQQAQVNLSQAQLDLNQAISDSLQTGAVETALNTGPLNIK